MKRVKQHKKLGSDGIADLKKLYQVERQQQAEIFLLDFISSDESLDPITKGPKIFFYRFLLSVHFILLFFVYFLIFVAQLIVKCLNQWQFGLDLMNNIIKSCESSMEVFIHRLTFLFNLPFF